MSREDNSLRNLFLGISCILTLNQEGLLLNILSIYIYIRRSVSTLRLGAKIVDITWRRVTWFYLQSIGPDDQTQNPMAWAYTMTLMVDALCKAVGLNGLKRLNMQKKKNNSGNTVAVVMYGSLCIWLHNQASISIISAARQIRVY